MNNWKEEKIGDLCKTFAGGTPNRSNESFYGGDIPWISSGEVNQAAIYETKEKITDKGLKFSSAKWIPINAVLVAMYGATAGQVSKLKIKATSNQAVLAVIPHKDDIDFFYYQLNQIKNEILFLAQGSGQPNLSKSLIDKTYIKIPKLPHQQKIAKILNTIDVVIAKTENAIAKYQAIKKGMMHDLFTRGIDVKTGQLRPSFADAPELYNESVLGMIPKDWEVERLDQVATVVSGGTPSTENSDFWGGNILWASPTDITKTSGRIIYKTEKTISKLGLKNSSARILPKGTLLMTSRATLGEIKIANSEITTNQGFKSLIINEGQDSWFYFYYMSLQKVRYASFGIGTTFLEVNKKDTDAFLVIKPKPTEQLEISKRLCNCDILIEREQKILAKHQNIKKGLMQDLLTGKVEVKV